MIGTKFVDIEQQEISQRHSDSEHLKRALSDEIAQQTAAFLASGGGIENVPYGKVAIIELCEWTRGRKDGN